MFSISFIFLSSLSRSLDWKLHMGELLFSTACGLVSQTVVMWAYPPSRSAEKQFDYGSGCFQLPPLNMKGLLWAGVKFGDREARMSWWCYEKPPSENCPWCWRQHGKQYLWNDRTAHGALFWACILIHTQQPCKAAFFVLCCCYLWRVNDTISTVVKVWESED